MNSNMVKCKVCGNEISKKAKVCPKCGCRQKRRIWLGVLFFVVGLFIFVAAFGGGSDDTPKKVGDVEPKQDQSEPEVKQSHEKTTFGVGEMASMNDIVVTLLDVSENTGANYMNPEEGNVFVLCEFEIENNSSKDISVSSIMCFDAYVDDYSTSMSLTAELASDKNQLDGSVAPGKKMNGVIGYEVPDDWKEIEVHFTPDFWSNKEFIFVANK